VTTEYKIPHDIFILESKEFCFRPLW